VSQTLSSTVLKGAFSKHPFGMSLGDAKASNICSDNYQHNFSWNPIEASNKEEWL
jgi:hypothetical protein